MAGRAKASGAKAIKTGTKITLAIDIGGTGLKALLLDARRRRAHRARRASRRRGRRRRERSSPRSLALVAAARRLRSRQRRLPGRRRRRHDPRPRRTSTGAGRASSSRESLERRSERPTRVLNDAGVQGFGVIEGKGVEMVLTLGTGMGCALYVDGTLRAQPRARAPPVPRQARPTRSTSAAARSRRSARRSGTSASREVLDQIDPIWNPRRIYLGGGNAKHLRLELPKHVQRHRERRRAPRRHRAVGRARELNAFAGCMAAERGPLARRGALCALQRDRGRRHGDGPPRAPARAGRLRAHRRDQAPAPAVREGSRVRLDVPRRGAPRGARPASERRRRRSTSSRRTASSSSSWTTSAASRSRSCSGRSARATASASRRASRRRSCAASSTASTRRTRRRTSAASRSVSSIATSLRRTSSSAPTASRACSTSASRRRRAASRSTRDGQIKGKLAYMPPEQLSGQRAHARSRHLRVRRRDVGDAHGRATLQGRDRRRDAREDPARPRPPAERVRPGLPTAFDAPLLQSALARRQRSGTRPRSELALELETCVGVASPTEVGEWVERIVGPVAQRARGPDRGDREQLGVRATVGGCARRTSPKTATRICLRRARRSYVLLQARKRTRCGSAPAQARTEDRPSRHHHPSHRITTAS